MDSFDRSHEGSTFLAGSQNEDKRLKSNLDCKYMLNDPSLQTFEEKNNLYHKRMTKSATICHEK